MEKDKTQKTKESSRYLSEKEVSGSSRYSRAENLRTGSRYAEQERIASEKKEKEERHTAVAVHWKQISFSRRMREKDPVSLALTVLICLVALAYIIVAVYFSGRFYPGTTIFGINCTAKTSAWVREAVDEKIGSYKLSVEERDGKNETIDAGQIGLAYSDQGAIENRLDSQKSFIWPVMMLIMRGRETPIETEYSAQALEETMQNMVCFDPENVTAPVDAHLQATDTAYEIVPEELGNTLNYDEALEAIRQALENGDEEVSLEMEACYEWPKIYEDDAELKAEMEARNEIVGADITLDFSDRTERINAEKIMEFAVQKDDGSYYVSDEKIRSYVSELADKYDTYGKPHVFNTTIGTVETLYDGDYGWLMSQEDTAQLIIQGIDEKLVETIEPIYIYTAKSRDTDDIGGTYVEVCISQQEMWCYRDGELMVDTPVVTGNPNKGNATPSGGVWAVDAKMTDYTLVGENYRSPVDYWIPFNGNIGIHDMQTRYYFGSTIYLTNGSHGCINTPLDQVSIIYDIVSVGTPVIVYE